MQTDRPFFQHLNGTWAVLLATVIGVISGVYGYIRWAEVVPPSTPASTGFILFCASIAVVSAIPLLAPNVVASRILRVGSWIGLTGIVLVFGLLALPSLLCMTIAVGQSWTKTDRQQHIPNAQRRSQGAPL